MLHPEPAPSLQVKVTDWPVVYVPPPGEDVVVGGVVSTGAVIVVALKVPLTLPMVTVALVVVE